MKYLRVQFNDKSIAKENEINVSEIWNAKADNPKDMGGFNFSTEDKILRWLVRGDTLYDVEFPDDAEIIDVPNNSAPHGVFRTNKIIITNPRKVTDEIAMDLYKKSNLPEKSYFKALAGLAVRGYWETCKQVINDKITEENKELAINEIKDFIKPTENQENLKLYKKILNLIK